MTIEEIIKRLRELGAARRKAAWVTAQRRLIREIVVRDADRN